jgi:hypothetical protein
VGFSRVASAPDVSTLAAMAAAEEAAAGGASSSGAQGPVPGRPSLLALRGPEPGPEAEAAASPGAAGRAPGGGARKLMGARGKLKAVIGTVRALRTFQSFGNPDSREYFCRLEGPLDMDPDAPLLSNHLLGAPTADDIRYMLSRWRTRNPGQPGQEPEEPLVLGEPRDGTIVFK